MADIPHPITLEQIVFTRSIVVAMPSHTPSSDVSNPAPENTINITAIPDQPSLFQVSMRTLFNKEASDAYPYQIDMECFCILRVDESLNDADIHRGVTITGHSVVFGAIREAVCWITGRQPFGPLTLGLSVLRPVSTQ